MRSNKSPVNRRSFLKGAGVAVAGVSTYSARARSRIPGANNRLNVGLIGCGNIGNSHLKALLGMAGEANIDVVGICDVYQTRAQHFQDRIAKVGGNPSRKRDYRELLEMKEVDYVAIAVPEHQHAPMTLNALDAGKHLYCEKPMTHTIAEAQAVVSKVNQTGLKMQVGVQGMSDDSYSSANRAIRAGKLGPVVEAQMDYVRNYPANLGPWKKGVREDLPLPSDLDWDAWLGSAPKRPWSASRYYEWRNYKDYSGGISSDLFIHRLTRILKACDLTHPRHMVGMGGIYLWDDGRELPDNFELLGEYGAVEGVTPGMTLHMLGTMANEHGSDHCIRGHKATLIFTKEGWKIIDEASKEVLETHVKTGSESIELHHKNLQSAIRYGSPLACPVELGFYGVTAIVMANESWFQKRMISWDFEASKMV